MLVGTKSICQSCKVGKRGADSVDPVPLFYTPYPSPDNESQNTTFRRVKVRMVCGHGWRHTSEMEQWSLRSPVCLDEG